MTHNNENKEFKNYNCTAHINFRLMFKMKAQNFQELAVNTLSLILVDDLIRWQAEHIASFLLSTSTLPNESDEVDSCFMIGDRLQNGSYSIQSINDKEDLSFEYKMPYNEEINLGFICPTDESEDLMTYTVMLNVVYERENCHIVAKDLEEANTIIIKMLLHSNFVKWKVKNMLAFNIMATEKEDLDNDAEFSYVADRVTDDCFEITQNFNGHERTVCLVLPEDKSLEDICGSIALASTAFGPPKATC